MDFESQFGRALGDAGHSNDIEIQPLIDRGLRRGRIIRGRRIVGAAVGAAAVAALIPIGAVQLTGQSSTRPASVATATSSARPTMSGTQILGLLKGMLPPGDVSEQQANGVGGGRPYDTPASARLVYDDGHGPALLQLSSARKDDTEVVGATSCPTGKPSYIVSCHETTRSDGSTLMVNEETFGKSNLGWTASLATRAGDRIWLQEFNTTTEQPGSPITRAKPPLTTTQLSAIVENSAWSPLFAAERAALPDGQPTQAQVIATARKLQPHGVTFGSNNAANQEGTANLPVIKGTNKESSLNIRVQYWPVKAGDEVKQQSFPQPSTTTLPNGTLIVTNQRSGTTLTVWDVQILAPDGTDVSLSEQCMHFPNTAAERPALSMAQLKTIALSPAWDRPSA